MTTPEPYGEQPGQPPTYPPPPPGAFPPPGPYPQQGYPQQGYPPPYPGGYRVDAYGNALSEKSKLVAGLLQIFLGSFGVGRFYLGYVGIGVAQILVTWLTFGLGAIWPFIDGILMLLGRVRDAKGRPLRE